MIKVISMVTSVVSTNTFIVYNDSQANNQAIVIDPGDDYNKIMGKLQDNNLKCEAVLLTHGHFDHANAAKKFQDNGVKVYIHEIDSQMLCTDANLGSLAGIEFNQFSADIMVRDDEILNIANMTIKVIFTPGHTAGSVCYMIGDIIFSGDTLFYKNIGRTDLPSGNTTAIVESIRTKLFTLEGDYEVLCGHDRFTTLAFEKENNPYA